MSCIKSLIFFSIITLIACNYENTGKKNHSNRNDVLVSDDTNTSLNNAFLDLVQNRKYQDSIIGIDTSQVNIIKRIKHLISEYTSKREYLNTSIYNYYLARLYSYITIIKFKGFLYDDINETMNPVYKDDYINFNDSAVYYAEKTLQLDKNNINAMYILCDVIFYDIHRGLLNSHVIPNLSSRNKVFYTKCISLIVNKCSDYRNIDTSQNKYLSRGINEVALYILNVSETFKENYTFDVNNENKINFLYKVGEILDFLNNYQTFEYVDFKTDYFKNNVYPNVKLAREYIQDKMNSVKVDNNSSTSSAQNIKLYTLSEALEFMQERTSNVGQKIIEYKQSNFGRYTVYYFLTMTGNGMGCLSVVSQFKLDVMSANCGDFETKMIQFTYL